MARLKVPLDKGMRLTACHTESASTVFVSESEWVFQFLSPCAYHETSDRFRDLPLNTFRSYLEGTAQWHGIT
jgi:hypothetical protein